MLRWHPEGPRERLAAAKADRAWKSREWKAERLYFQSHPLGCWAALSERERDAWREAVEAAFE